MCQMRINANNNAPNANYNAPDANNNHNNNNHTPTRAPETYIHRVGRTGRFGAEGIAVSLIGNREVCPSLPPSLPTPLPPFRLPCCLSPHCLALLPSLCPSPPLPSVYPTSSFHHLHGLAGPLSPTSLLGMETPWSHREGLRLGFACAGR